jgi:predicted ATPase
LASARAHLEQAIALYSSQAHRSLGILYGQDPGLASLSYAAIVLGYLGYPDQSLRRGQETLSLAQDLAHPMGSIFALFYAGTYLHQLRREAQLAQKQAEMTIALATEEGFPFFAAMGTMVLGSALVAQGQAEEGLAEIRRGQTMWGALGTQADVPYWLALLAEAYGSVGQSEEGLRVLDEALNAVEKTGEGFHEAEIHRLKGELLSQGAKGERQKEEAESEVEACYQKAIGVARQQSARSLELRATVSLCRLWQKQGKKAEACQLLAEIYGWFTEGFDTTDLKEARTLLDALS